MGIQCLEVVFELPQISIFIAPACCHRAMLVEPVLEMMLLFDAQPELRSRLPQTLSINLVMQQVQVGLPCVLYVLTPVFCQH